LIGTAKDGVFASDGKNDSRRTGVWYLERAGGAVDGAHAGRLAVVRHVSRRLLVAPLAAARSRCKMSTRVSCSPDSGTNERDLVRHARQRTRAHSARSGGWSGVSELDSEQGLPSQNVFAVLPQRNAAGNEALLIGTTRGIARYQPGRFAPALSVTRLLSKRVHAPAELQAGLNLEYPQNSLLLDVTAISSRTFPEQFQYAFTLTDSGGHAVKQKLSRDSQFTMEGLKPGKYTVTARAFTKDLTPSSPLTFSFTVAKAPFPWTSTALAILLALALLALLWAILERRRIVATSAALVARTASSQTRVSISRTKRNASDAGSRATCTIKHSPICVTSRC
jgi:hypothetical protein